eukprot:TRINITY_DN64546_c0_g1_i1.p1 TRINITY_DN64546_c0_g1~~TRINITY_DN64546_c0_g1_i1.p1  ORF type:complete len:685 (-),score=135.60 TRINITY_DN64546_c0_g1_i1:156-2210(-)
MPLSCSDALAAHAAIHGSASSVKLSDGSSLPVEKAKNGCRSVKFPEVNAMEQNKSKSSDWASKAKKGVKITWFIVPGAPAGWGRIVAGKIENKGKAIVDASDIGASSSSGSTASSKKRSAPSAAEPSGASTKRAKVEPIAKPQARPEPVVKAKATSSSASDPLSLSPLFAGLGHGPTWEAVLKPVIEALPKAASFIGPSRDRRIVPVRELTFQALKPNPPSGWRVVSFGQSPYPRIESATGIAHFDNAITDWGDSRFGSVVTMRCIIKAAAMNKFGIAKTTSTADLRKLLSSKGCVGPSEWFQAMLAQGVLFMNAACTLLPPEGKSVRAGEVIQEHLKFWQPVIEAVVSAILEDCSKTKRGVIFAWWGSESLKVKKVLNKSCFASYPNVKIEHIEHKNPAAMGDAFCDEPNVFQSINKAISKLKLGHAIDWLPTDGWQKQIKGGKGASVADQMGAFISETQDLHKMYLERLKDGLDDCADNLANISGIMSQPLLDLMEACKPLKLIEPAEASTSRARAMKSQRGGLSIDEAAALHLYTTNFLYKNLNAALRDPDRKQVNKFFPYLRLFLTALHKLPCTKQQLYRGVALDLSEQYKLGTEVTWWAVSSCTPDLKVASSFSGNSKKSTLFIISSQRSVGIRKFSEYKSEEECILAPGTEFKVSEVSRKGNSVEIHLEELTRVRRVQ